MSEHLSECSTKVLGTSNVSANIRLKKEGNLDDFLKGKKIDRQTISNLDLKRMGARHPNVCDEGYKLNNKSQKGKIPYYGKRNLNAYLTHSTKSEKPVGNFLMSRDENIIDVVDERVNKDTSKITDSLIRIKEENGESCSSISLTECFDEIEQAKWLRKQADVHNELGNKLISVAKRMKANVRHEDLEKRRPIIN